MLVPDMSIAQEIVQEAFTKLWASSKTPTSEPEFRRYLYRTLANLAHDHHRARRRLAALPIPTRSPVNPLDEVERRLGGESIRLALLVLPLRQRHAVYLRYFEDHSIAETARIMGAPQVTVRVLVYRGLSKLRHHLAGDLAGNRAVT